jgi:hypothetical protein
MSSSQRFVRWAPWNVVHSHLPVVVRPPTHFLDLARPSPRPHPSQPTMRRLHCRSCLLHPSTPFRHHPGGANITFHWTSSLDNHNARVIATYPMSHGPGDQDVRVWTPRRDEKMWRKIHDSGKNDKEGGRWASKVSLSRGYKCYLFPSDIPVSSLLRISGLLK